MIKTLSPYYINVPLVNPNSSVVCNSYTVKLFIWKGNKTAVPSVADYEITKINASASNGTDKVNIARIVNDFIDFNCIQSTVTSLENSDNQTWVRFFVLYNDQPTIPQLQFIELAIKGYGYFMEGENPTTPANKILLDGDEFKVNRNGTFVLPILLNETPPAAPSIIIESITDIGGGFFELVFSHIGTYLSMELFIDEIGSPFDLLINYDAPTSPLTLSVSIPVSTTDFEFTLTGFDIVSGTNVTSNVFTLTLP